MAVTAKDIAKKLGISPSAVSLAMNGRPGISVLTREKILAEAIRMGYSVSKNDGEETVRNIRYVIFLDEGSAVKETSFYSIILQGIEALAKKNSFNVLVSYFYASDDWRGQIRSVTKDMAGLIVLGTEVEDRHIALAQDNGMGELDIPMVLVDNATGMVDIDCVVSDNFRGAYCAASYLYKKGHRDIGYLRSKSRIDNFDERLSGFMRARKELDGAGALEIIDVGISSEQAFYDMCAWLDAGGRPRSAYFAENDIIAAACIRALKSRGYRVPEDVSVVGFDDMPISSMTDPPLTTIQVMKEQMGETAMGLLMRRIADGTHALNRKRTGVFRAVISTQLVERESVAECRSGIS